MKLGWFFFLTSKPIKLIQKKVLVGAAYRTSELAFHPRMTPENSSLSPSPTSTLNPSRTTLPTPLPHRHFLKISQTSWHAGSFTSSPMPHLCWLNVFFTHSKLFKTRILEFRERQWFVSQVQQEWDYAEVALALPPCTSPSLPHPHPHLHADQSTTVLRKNAEEATKSFGNGNSAGLKCLNSEEGSNGGCWITFFSKCVYTLKLQRETMIPGSDSTMISKSLNHNSP